MFDRRLRSWRDRFCRKGVDLAMLTEAQFWPLIEHAKERVLTNDLDALERLIVDGLPADEMQAAAWVLVQRVRGLHADLRRLARGEPVGD